jgi:two-component system phosphate regulon sensor histidine kinase PhoR
LFAGSAPEGVSWTLTTASSSSSGGAARASSLARDIAGTDEDWRLHVLPAAPLSAGRARERVIGSAVAAAIGFIWAAVFFIGRAIQREAHVARLQSDFVAAVSHEFRTPVTAVRQISEMLDMRRLDDAGRVQQYYSVLVGQSMRLQRLVETLLTFGRMEAGVKRYQLVPTDIESVVRGAVADVVTLAEHSRTTVEVAGEPEPVIVDADEDALRMAVRNLLDNAIKYSPGRPVVWIRWRTEAERAAIEVEDHGLGIVPAEQRTIFRKFVRGDAAVAARVKGTGVGLAVVQHIVTAHRGALTVVSEPGRGSTFSILLPCRDGESGTVAGAST